MSHLPFLSVGSHGTNQSLRNYSSLYNLLFCLKRIQIFICQSPFPHATHVDEGKLKILLLATTYAPPSQHQFSYSENYKTLLKETKDLNKWKEQRSLTGRLSVIKMAILSKLVYRFNTISFRFPALQKLTSLS